MGLQILYHSLLIRPWEEEPLLSPVYSWGYQDTQVDTCTKWGAEYEPGAVRLHRLSTMLGAGEVGKVMLGRSFILGWFLDIGVTGVLLEDPQALGTD